MSDFDVSEIRKLAFDLGKGNAAMVTGARGIVNMAALKIKTGMSKDAKKGAGKHARLFPSSITYDIKGLEAEIGPDKSRKQGALGNVLYFGTSTKGPVLPSIDGPLKAEAPIMAALLAALGERSIL